MLPKKLKWGFNALALFDEALERQRLFLESQYGAWPEYGVEPADYRTLVYRFVSRPGEGLSLAVLGKIHARTEADARRSACSYFRELKSTFPYDYTLLPAGTEQEFKHMSARDLLDQELQPLGLAQIKRLELPLYADRSAPRLQGVWHSGPRAHEQIWRSLAASPLALLLNLSLRRTILYDKERDLLSKTLEEVSGTRQRKAHSKTIAPLQNWHHAYVDRRLAPWEKFFYLQVHLASSQELSTMRSSESVVRIELTSRLGFCPHQLTDLRLACAMRNAVLSSTRSAYRAAFLYCSAADS